ncbi:MAG: class I SAM-dependent methyltransferase [Anaerolineales bacterium]|nr:class I SAM-dependent methyltransferase [Anaerolineales bacterium]
MHDNTETSTYDRLLARYREGSVPWDAAQPPPEVMATLPTLLPGRALDLGCGYGRASIYMAQHGWQVDGVDFIAEALVEARRRAADAGVETAVAFHVGPVTAMPFLAGPYDLALDVGCMHNFGPAQLAAYAAELRRLVRPGGLYLLFAHVRDEGAEPDESWRWIAAEAIEAAFADGFTLQRKEPGETHVGDNVWRSAWFWFVRDGS